MNSFMSWVGGKKALRDVVLARFPPYYERYIEVFGGAKNGATSVGASITFDDVMKLFYSVKSPYCKKAVWVLNEQTLKMLCKVKDSTGNYYILLINIKKRQNQEKIKDLAFLYYIFSIIDLRLDSNSS